MSDSTGLGVAVVTGASRGIGRAIAKRLADDGHSIVAVARSEPDLASLAAEIRRAGGRCEAVPLDVTNADAVARALSGVDAGVLVNNAGVGSFKPMLDLSLEEWRAMVDVNLNALFYVTRVLLPSMIRRGGGDIVNIGSIAGRTTFAGGTCYAATKHALMAFTESLWLEVRERNVRVSVVMPGSIATELRTSPGVLAGREDTSWMLTPADVADAVAYVVSRRDNALVARLEVRPNRPPPRSA